MTQAHTTGSERDVAPDVSACRTYAAVSWSIADVQEMYDVTEQEATEFLERYRKGLEEAMIMAGWDVIEYLGNCDGMKRWPGDEWPDEE